MGQYVPYDPSEIPGGSLNNFFCHFPANGPYERTMPEGYYRSLLKDGGAWDVSLREFLEEDSIYEVTHDRSEKRLDQIPAEFYAEIDRMIVEVGLTVEAVARVINIYLHHRDLVSREVSLQMNTALDAFLLPIYIALRNKGYSRQDLWG